MADQTELRMNLAAIKRVDPYAKSIVDSSAHVAFYTFNSNDTEWEKTDVEGAFFIYSRNAEPFFSIFINNRLNTNSLVEPISGQLELQSQPPFLLYRNERSRIRGFWFYNKTECDRIGELVDRLIKDSEKNHKNANVPPGLPVTTSSAVASNKKQPQQQSLADIMSARPTNTTSSSAPQTMVNKSGVDIFTMLTKAQEDFNNAQVVPGSGGGVPTPSKVETKTQHHQQQQVQAAPGNNQQQQQPDVTSQSVMNFFAAAKPATAKEVPFFQRMLSNPVHVDQIEKQHRTVTPQEKQSPPKSILQPQQAQRQPQSQQKQQQTPNSVGLQSNENGFGLMRITSPHQTAANHHELGTSPLASFINTANLSGMARASGGQLGSGATNVSELEFRQQPLNQLLKKSESSTIPGKPALMPPTMFTSGGQPHSVASVNQTSPPGGNLVTQLHQQQQQQQQQHAKKEVLAPPPGIQPLHIIHRDAMKHQQASTPIAMHMVGNQWLPMAQKAEGALQQQQPINRQPEPLTQSQLLQAMSYLIKNDPDFVRKLHEAYLKSFTEMVSL